MSEPLLSIVIANYNYGRFIEEAIKSVLSQNCVEVELIVVDGGSTDNSVEVIKKYATPESKSKVEVEQRNSKISYWVSEPDKGQSDAFNKGFAHARGKYLTWVNADDMMVPGSLAKVIAAMKAHPECEWFTGNYYRMDKDGRRTEVFWGPHWYPKFLQRKTSPIVAYGPATFFSKRIFDAAGGMNVACHYTMDTDLWARFIVAGIKQRRINCFCWAFRMHEASKTAEFGDHGMDAEHRKAMCEEERATYARTGYQPTRVMRLMLKVWKLLDGSYIRACWMKRRCHV